MMRPRLLGLDSDGVDTEAVPDADLLRDLELDVLLDAMADGDEHARAVCRTVLTTPADAPADVLRRQDAASDCRVHPDAVAALDAIAVRATERDRDDPLWMLTLRPTPNQQVAHAARRLAFLLPLLDDLRRWCAYEGRGLGSRGFLDLLDTVQRSLDDAALDRLRAVQRELTFPDGVVVSATLDRSGQVAGQHLRRARAGNRRLLGGTPMARPHRTYRIPERDQAGFDAFAELVDRSLQQVAVVAGDGVARLEHFFAALHDELAYLRAAARLHERLIAVGVPLVLPRPAHHDAEMDRPVDHMAAFRAEGLVDPCLALRTGAVPVANDVTVRPGEVLVITGANHGGKSTLLRAIGIAQLMLQGGLHAPARSCSAALIGRLRTHWPRAEDEGLQHGKLDDELARMSEAVDALAPGDLLLSNESFASTNEREGAAIALEVVGALARAGVRVALVTHLHDLAEALITDPATRTVSLRAPRDDGGGRSYRLEVGAPLPTSYGADLFDDAFGTDLAGRGDARSTRTSTADPDGAVEHEEAAWTR